jgi:hypothetical protein
MRLLKSNLLLFQVKYTTEVKTKIIFLFGKYGNCKYVQRAMRKMQREDPNDDLIIPSVKAIRRIVSKFREEGTIQNKPNRGGQPAKIVEAKALEVKQLLAENPDSNLKQIAEKAKIAITSLRRLTEIASPRSIPSR